MNAALKLYRDAESQAGQPGARKRWRLAAHALATLTSDTGAQLAYATACATHKRADWRIAAKALFRAVGGKEPVSAVAIPERKPMTLLAFLSRAGGLKDTGGDLKAMGAEHWRRRAPFRRKLISDTGLALDYAADLAAERGYVAAYASPSLVTTANMDDDLHPVSAAALLEAIERELAGHDCLPVESDWVPYVEPEPDDVDALYAETWPESVDAWTASVMSAREAFEAA